VGESVVDGCDWDMVWYGFGTAVLHWHGITYPGVIFVACFVLVIENIVVPYKFAVFSVGEGDSLSPFFFLFLLVCVNHSVCNNSIRMHFT
jgi:hypothetical protein